MQLTTRSVRNVAFATMVAVTPLVQFEEVSAEGQECGVYGPCAGCFDDGGWMYTHFFGCDECDPQGGCYMFDCDTSCHWCSGSQNWICS